MPPMAKETELKATSPANTLAYWRVETSVTLTSSVDASRVDFTIFVIAATEAVVELRLAGGASEGVLEERPSMFLIPALVRLLAMALLLMGGMVPLMPEGLSAVLDATLNAYEGERR